MSNKDKTKSLAKDIAIALTVLVPLLFIVVGGLIWNNGGFDGTIMEEFFPAMFFGFLAAYAVLIIFSNIFNHGAVWVIGAIITFIATIIFYMLNLTTVLTVGGIALLGALFLLCLIKTIIKPKKASKSYYSSSLGGNAPQKNSANDTALKHPSTSKPFVSTNISPEDAKPYKNGDPAFTGNHVALERPKTVQRNRVYAITVPSTNNAITSSTETNTPLFCKHCGAQLLPNSNYCVKCGTKVESF